VSVNHTKNRVVVVEVVTVELVFNVLMALVMSVKMGTVALPRGFVA
jgi:hypothetical protein